MTVIDQTARDMRSPDAKEMDEKIAAVRTQRLNALKAKYAKAIRKGDLTDEQAAEFADGLGLTGEDFLRHKNALETARQLKRNIDNAPSDERIAELEAAKNAAYLAAHTRAITEIVSYFAPANLEQILYALPILRSNCTWLQRILLTEPEGTEQVGVVVARSNEAEDTYKSASTQRERNERELYYLRQSIDAEIPGLLE